MAESRTDKNRKNKVDAFKEKAKEEAKQGEIPKSHLIPITDWNSKENLDLRGDLFEALEHQLLSTFQQIQDAKTSLNQAQAEFQKVAHIAQMIIQQNIKSGKITLKYQWNNGEDATPEEVTKYESKMNELRELQKKNFEAVQQQKNAEKTGLVGADGSPIGTTQDLDSQTDVVDSGNTDSDVVNNTASQFDDGQPGNDSTSAE